MKTIHQLELEEEYRKGLEAGKILGGRKVVEWINDTDILVMLPPRKRREWQTKQKEWQTSGGR